MRGGGGVTHCTLSYLFTFLPSILSASSESGAYFAGVSLSPGILRREEMAAFRLPSIFFPYVIKIICTGNTFNTFLRFLNPSASISASHLQSGHIFRHFTKVFFCP